MRTCRRDAGAPRNNQATQNALRASIKMKKGILIALMLAGVAIAGFWYKTWGLGRLPDRRTQLHGNVDIREVSLGFRVSGRLKEVLKDEGDIVKAGETLARLDDEPYRREEQESRSQLG